MVKEVPGNSYGKGQRAVGQKATGEGNERLFDRLHVRKISRVSQNS